MRKITPVGNQSLNLAVGESVVLQLEELPGAGFLWKLDDRLGECARLDAITYQDTAPGDAIGGAACRVVMLTATNPGTGVLSGIRGQQWESSEKADRWFTLQITVD